MISVSINIDVPNLADAGAIQEQIFENPKHGSVAFCCDPFGHGFCLIERKRKQ